MVPRRVDGWELRSKDLPVGAVVRKALMLLPGAFLWL